MTSLLALAWPGVLMLGTLLGGAIALVSLWRAVRWYWLLGAWLGLVGPWLPVFWIAADGVPDLLRLVPPLWLSPGVAVLLAVATGRRAGLGRRAP